LKASNRSSALSDSTAAAAMASCTSVSTSSQRRPRRSRGAAIALPMAMPARTDASMIVNAYAVGRSSVTSMRNQTISSASDITPDNVKVSRIARP